MNTVELRTLKVGDAFLWDKQPNVLFVLMSKRSTMSASMYKKVDHSRVLIGVMALSYADNIAVTPIDEEDWLKA